MIAKVVSTLKDDDNSKKGEINQTGEEETSEKSKSISPSSDDLGSSPETLSSRYYCSAKTRIHSVICDKIRKSSEDDKDVPRHMKKIKETIYRNTEDPDLKELEKNIAARLGSLYTEKVEKNMSSSNNENEGLMFDVGQQDKRMASALKR